MIAAYQASSATAPARPLTPPTSDVPRITTLVGGLGSGSAEIDSLRRERLRAEQRALEETSALLDVLRCGAALESSQARELVLAQAVIWLPHVSREWADLWSSRPDVDLDFVPAAMSMLADDSVRGGRPEAVRQDGLPEALSPIAESVDWETWDPLVLVMVLHGLYRLVGSRRLGPDVLPQSCLTRMEKATARLELLLLTGDYRRRGGMSDSPQLLLCAASELWRRNVVQASWLRAPLEDAVRWELQVDAAETIMARSALIIAAENLHLRGVDLRGRRGDLLDALDASSVAKSTTGRLRPGLLRHPDGRIFSAGPLIAQILMIRALIGQPRSSCNGELFAF